jgi:cysteine-rich repeat protein
MMKHVCLALLVAVAGCGDNWPNFPPQVASSRLALSTAEDGTIEIDTSAVDPEGQNLSYTISEALHGTITGSGPRFLYTPAANYSGRETLAITVSDGINIVDIAVELTVSAVNDAPVAADQQAAVNEGDGVAITLLAIDVDGPALSYSIDVPPVHGTLLGTLPFLTYTPGWHYFGGDSFTFEASDGALRSNVATVTISVVNVITCGDGVVEGAEQCDDGNDDDTDACLTTCQTARCGDGFVEAGIEECDDGNDNDNDACSNTCTRRCCCVAQLAGGCADGNGDLCVTGCVTAM